MKKRVSVGILLIILGAAIADSANLYPSIILMISGSLLIMGQKLCGTLAP